MTNKKNIFEILPMRQRQPNIPANSYRIYKDPDNFVIVEAENAKDALAASGLAQAYRIRRNTIFLENVLGDDKFAAAPPAAEPDKAVENPAIAAPETAPPPAQAVADPNAPLSDDAVDKLLQGN